MGAHPDEPSVLADGPAAGRGDRRASPTRLLGAPVRERFGARLPFLMKVLAADQPLSLQAHPTTEQAQAGFAAEEAAGIPHDDPTRTFKDPFHKPELLLRADARSRRCAASGRSRSRCTAWPSCRCPSSSRRSRRSPAAACARRSRSCSRCRRRRRAVAGERGGRAAAARFVAAHDPEFINTYRWAASLAETYPGDPGVVISLMCNHLKLAPGEAVFLPAGNLHAYLSRRRASRSWPAPTTCCAAA